MRIYIIGNDGITLCREAPATVNEGEIAVASKEELHAARLPALQVPHAPTCSRGNAALAAHAQSRDSARHPGDGLSATRDGRNVVDQQARTLTQPRTKGGLAGPNFHQRPWLLGALSEPAKTQANPPLFRVGWDKRGQPRSNLKSGPSAKEEGGSH